MLVTTAVFQTFRPGPLIYKEWSARRVWLIRHQRNLLVTPATHLEVPWETHALVNLSPSVEAASVRPSNQSHVLRS